MNQQRTHLSAFHSLLTVCIIAALALPSLAAQAAKGQQGAGGKKPHEHKHPANRAAPKKPADKKHAGKKPEDKQSANGKSKARVGTGKGGKGGDRPSTHDVVRADVMKWLLAHNPGLKANFLQSAPPDTTIKLPTGQTTPIFKLKQFLDVNFRLTFYVRVKQKGDNVVPEMEKRMRLLMARPEFRDFILKHRNQYKINPKGKVDAHEAYHHFRSIHRNLSVTAGKQFKAPVGGGGGIAAPSWAVWKAMNIMFHEACHCIGINHDSGGLSGPLAGAMRKWDKQKKWKYDVIDLNKLAVNGK